MMILALMSLFAACTGEFEDFVSQVRFLVPPPFRHPRIYARAPSGVGVTWVRAVYTDERRAALAARAGCQPRYYLSPSTEDFGAEPQFTLDECEGIVQTHRSVEKSIGDHYNLRVVAVDDQNVTLAALDLVIQVAEYNVYSPYLIHTYNSHEIFEGSKLGTLVMTLEAVDKDAKSYNRELFFFIQDTLSSKKDPWLFPTTSPLNISDTTGEIRVSGDLTKVRSPLSFYVGVGDSGSPQRRQTVKMVVHIRKMSAPVNVSIDNIRKNSARLCWSPPKEGEAPKGYIIMYRGPSHSQNISLPLANLYSRSVTHEGKITAKEYCYTLGELIPYTHYIVNIKAWNDNGVSLPLENSLAIYTRGHVCTKSLCGNGVCQEIKREPFYSCICAEGYHGVNCQLEDPCVTKRDEHSSCHNGCLQSGKNCLCTSAISEGECPLSSRCLSLPSCFTGDPCASPPAKDFYCHCNFNYEGKYCPDQSKESIKNISKCEESTTSHPGGDLKWPQTLVGGTIVLPCPNLPRNSRVTRSTPHSEEYIEVEPELVLPENLVRISRSPKDLYEFVQAHSYDSDSLVRSKGATRKCQANSDNLGLWLEPDLSFCDRFWEYDTKTTSLPGVPSSAAPEEEEKDFNLPEIHVQNTPLETVEHNFRDLVHFAREANSDTQTLSRIGEALDVLLASNISLLEEEESGAAETIRGALQEYGATVPLQSGENLTLKTPNVVVETRFLAKEDITEGVSFRPSFETGREEDPLRADSSGANETEILDSLHLTIPKEALESIKEKKIRFQFVSFKDDRLFQGKAGQKSLNMPVISAEVVNHKIKNLETPILFSIPVPKGAIVEGKNPSCVYWQEPDSRWSTEGLNVVRWSEKEVLCQSSHLTAFSVLLDPVAEPIDSGHQAAFSFITYAGLTLSTASLLLTIATFSLFRCLNRDRSGAIVMNLSLALLFLNISFIGASLVTPANTVCIPFAALVHYSVTASFTWMLIEALNMHSLLVTVFPSVETHFMVKRVTAGWGFPVILVAIALIWNREVYANYQHDLCIISPVSYKAVYYFAYFAPICVILGINCVVFILVSKVLCRRRLGSVKSHESPGKPSHKRFPVTLAQIRGAVTVVALLGVTWVAGPLSVGSFRVFFQYLFCIATPLQGFIIFFVRVIQSAEARAAWYSFLTTGSRNRRHKYPPSSMRTNSSTQNTPSVNTQSTGFATQKSVFASAMKLARRLSLASENQQGTARALNPSALFAKKGRSFGEKWSFGPFQRNRKKASKEDAKEDPAMDSSQNYNQVYGLYFQPEDHQDQFAPPMEDCSCVQDCVHARNSLLEDPMHFLTTGVIPYDKEAACEEEDRCTDVQDSCTEGSSVANGVFGASTESAGKSALSLEDHERKASQFHTALKKYFKKDLTI